MVKKNDLNYKKGSTVVECKYDKNFEVKKE